MNAYLKLRTILLCCCILCAGWSCMNNNTDTRFRVMCFNIWYDNPNNTDYPWTKRKPIALSAINRMQPDIIGMQEVLHHQLEELATALPAYKWVGVGRDDGQQKGEYAPIFYRAEDLGEWEHGYFWLSETPDVPGSRSWDAAITRMVTWVHFLQQDLYVFNTHFDHEGVIAREQSSLLLLKMIDSIAQGNPVILMGDFNCKPDSRAYATLVSKFVNTTELAAKREGPAFTYHGNLERPDTTKAIDHVFVLRSHQRHVIRHKVWDYQEEGMYPSDHFPVVVEFKGEKWDGE